MKNNIDALKQFSNQKFIEEKKIIINIYNMRQNCYNMGVFISYISSKKKYEVYCFIENSETIASGLHYKNFRIKTVALLYFKYLIYKIEKQKLKFFFNQ